jgi:predicted nucleic acid-binding protein
MTNKVLLDKNIIVDIIAARPRRNKVLELFDNFDEFYISINTFTTCFYILKKDNFSKEEIYLFIFHNSVF